MSAPTPSAGETDDSRILSSSALMAAGTVVSRLSGFVRSALLVAALGAGLHADLFNVANTVPNMVYILIAGGIFNAVLVPQLVRAMRNDPDGGEAYTNRVMTLALSFLAVVTVLLVVAAPYVMDVFLASKYDSAALADQRQSIIDFARFCLPQVFFYGAFVLVGQVLNARGRFGPMMWAPIANNVIAVACLVVYLVAFGPVGEAGLDGAYSPGQEALLGLGSTLGIAVQLMVLVPFLGAAGFRFRPRFDFRGTGLGHTLRLGLWTVLFVVANQIAYAVVVNLASGGTAAAVGSADDGTGYTVYAYTFLIMMVPHSVVTVSLATAILPRLTEQATEADHPGLARTLGVALRTALVVVVPFALLMPIVALDVSHVIWGWGAGRNDYDLFAPALALFPVGLVCFTFHYLTLRGFYALERTRTVFFIQCAVAATNIAAALLLVRATTAEETAPALVAAYALSYAVGAVVSYVVLHRLLGSLQTPRLLRFGVRLLIAAGVSSGVALGVALGLHAALGSDPVLAVAGLRGLAVTVVDVVVFVVMARVVRLREVTDVLATLTRRVPGRPSPRP